MNPSVNFNEQNSTNMLDLLQFLQVSYILNQILQKKDEYSIPINYKPTKEFIEILKLLAQLGNYEILIDYSQCNMECIIELRKLKELQGGSLIIIYPQPDESQLNETGGCTTATAEKFEYNNSNFIFPIGGIIHSL